MVRALSSIAVGVLVLTGCGGNEPATQAATTTPTPTPTVTPTPTPSPQAVEAGEPFTIGQYEFTDWSFLPTSLEVSDVYGLVSNRGEAPGAASFDLTFFTGSVVLARFSCTSGQLQPSESERVECDQSTASVAATPKEPPYDRITAQLRA